MQAVNRYKIQRQQSPAHGFKYNVQIWTNYGGGFCYCGIGKFCKSFSEAMETLNRFKAEYNAQPWIA